MGMHPLTKWRQKHPTGYMTLRQLSALIAVSEAEICRWENGLRRIPAERVYLISDLTGIPKSKLRPDIFPPRSRIKKTA